MDPFQEGRAQRYSHAFPIRWRWYLLGVAILLLGMMFWYTYCPAHEPAHSYPLDRHKMASLPQQSHFYQKTPTGRF